MSRKEINAKFIVEIESLNMSVLRVACYVSGGDLGSLEDMGQVVNRLKNRFADDAEDWCVYSIAKEYNNIKDFSPNNLQIWANYRREQRAYAPIAKANGEFIEARVEGIKLTIDGVTVTINDCDFVSIDSNCNDGDYQFANISFATMEKMLQIKSQWNEIKRLVG